MFFSEAYKRADGIKIDGHRVVVDYERGRTNKAWLPRRLGGGKGDTRKAREPRHVIDARDSDRDGYRGDDRSYRERSTHSRERSSRRHDSREREDRDRNGSDRHRERNGSSDRYRDRDRRDDRRRRD